VIASIQNTTCGVLRGDPLPVEKSDSGRGSIEASVLSGTSSRLKEVM